MPSINQILTATLLSCSLLGGAAVAADSSSDEKDTHRSGPTDYRRLLTVPVPGSPLAVFDISYVDPRLPLYYLADRSNAALDIIETVHNKFLTRVGGFVGVRNGANGLPSTAVSGPNGVQPVGVGEVWVGDGDSTVKVVDLFTQKVVDVVSTIRTDEPGHTADTDKRADEMAYDPRDHILVAANNAATPPFVTFISTQPGHHQVLKQIVFSDYAGVEQPAYSPKTRKFYVNLTATNADPNIGGVAVVNPQTLTVERIFPLQDCNPAGLAVGARLDLLVGCSLTDSSQIISSADGSVETDIPQVAGSDQVWYNQGDHHYYLAARNNAASKGGPSLGIIDARDNSFIANVPTDVSAHSVAADARTGLVYVPLGPIAADPDCQSGCIGVYGPNSEPRIAER